MTSGVIVKGLGGFYFVEAAGKLYSCSLRGRLRKNEGGVLVGDRVELTILSEPDSKGVVEQILPRHNQLIRPKVANVEQGLIVLAATDPSPDFMLLDRLLILMAMAKMVPLICFNKADLITHSHVFWQQKAIYEKAGFQVMVTSTYQDLGKEPVLAALKNKITILAGCSGVGKSSLLNMLQAELQLTTGLISEKLGRGKHTTRCVELLPLDCGGWVADSPGFSRLDLPAELKEANLPKLYPEFMAVERQCKYDGCCHHLEPDCAVKAGVEQGEISKERYERYLQFLAELVDRKDY